MQVCVKGGALKQQSIVEWEKKKNLLLSFPIKINNFNNDPLIFLSIFLCDPSCYLQNTKDDKENNYLHPEKRTTLELPKNTSRKKWIYNQEQENNCRHYINQQVGKGIT